MSKETARKEIEKLIGRFEEHNSSYHNPSYDEATTRLDFINKFFKALGWDVDNEAGLHEAYREVVIEDRFKTPDRTNAPDFMFRLSGGKKLFFVEAKKPSVKIKSDDKAAYQLRRYGRSAQLPISILTNFEEFAIYDCTRKPSEHDSASFARIQYFTYKEYLNEFDFLYDTFSHEGITKGKFDAFVKSDTKKRGTITLDKDFLESLNEWRLYLARSIVNNNKLTEEEVKFAVQQTIDRLIFLRFCEDRHIEPYGQLRERIHTGKYYQQLFDVFKKAEAKYNSGLFNFRKDQLTPSLKVDDKVIKLIVEELYYPKCPYAFDVMPVEIMGNAYEQFLGKVIRITPGHIVKIEDKPEVRKAGGVYYTPQYIVEYIVKNTVGELINGTPSPSGKVGMGLTPVQIEKIKIVDPACGSGSFLLGAFQYLLDYHLKWYLDNPARIKKGKQAPLTPDQKLTTAEKRRILLNNIYGVDIDTQAVEVTKLSLLLKSMEGETEASLRQQLDLYHERILPNLDDNIKCGNSLIGPDYYDVKGALIKDESDDSTIRPFDWKEEFPQVFKQGGFDVVIGNPPYVRQELLGKSKNYFSAKYEVYNGVADLYSYFIEKGIGLLNDKGLFGFIVANKWMRANYGEQLRRWLKQRGIISIIDFGDLPVFTGATTYPCILICEKRSREKLSVTEVQTLSFDKLENYVQQNQQQIDKSSLNDEGWNLSGETEQKLIAKINQQGIALAKYVGDKIYRGVLTGLNEAFVIDEKTKQGLIKEDAKSREIIKPFLAGRDIKRYAPPNSNQFLIFSRRGLAIDKYPAIKNYLLQFKTQLMPKPENFKGNNWKGRKPGAYKWYELQDSIDYFPEFEKPKLMLPDIALRCQATYDENSFYCVNTAYIIPVSDKYLLGILNSSLIHFCYAKISTSIRGGYFRFIRQYLEILPIKKINQQSKKEKSLHDYIVKYVNQLLNLNQQLHQTKLQSKQEELQRRIAHAANKIDELVYKLYGLSKEEIEIVENSINQK